MQENKTYFFIPLFNISLQNTLQIYIFFHLALASLIRIRGWGFNILKIWFIFFRLNTV